MSDTENLRDSLPDDLNASEYVGPYQFPDNSRRRRLRISLRSRCRVPVAVAVTARRGPVLINSGMVWAAILLTASGSAVVHLGVEDARRQKQALVAAQGAVGFPVGHAWAQQVWRGLRSRPTWRVLVYSAESPPRQRSLVLVDAIDGKVVEHLTEDNPEDDWLVEETP
jgi:hypothetical protein